jgi:hypothetical protein
MECKTSLIMLITNMMVHDVKARDDILNIAGEIHGYTNSLIINKKKMI